METKTFSHTVVQRLKTYGKGQKILNIERQSNRPTSVSIVYFNRFAYEIGLDLNPVTSSCCCNIINQFFKFPAKIQSLIEGPTQSGIFALTQDGNIWKFNLSTIVEEEKPPRRDVIDNHCKIFGESLVKDAQRENDFRGVKSLFPCVELNQRFKIFCDDEVKDLFVSHNSVILVKQNVTELSLHSLAIRDDGCSSIPLLCVSFNNTLIYSNHLNERNYPISSPNLLAHPQNVRCIKFISHTGTTKTDFAVVRIGHQLFLSLFSPCQTLQNSVMLLTGDSNGKVFSFPANGILVEAAAEKKIDLKAGVSNILFDLQEPVIEIVVSSVREISFKHRGALNKINAKMSENESKHIENVLRNESVLAVVGRNGKLLLLLAPNKSYESFLFNQDHISGPITSVLVKEDVLFCSNSQQLNLYQLSIDAVFEEGKKIFVVPTFKPLHCISYLAVVSIASINIVPEQKNAQKAFLCTNKEGCLCNIVVKEDDNKDSSTHIHSHGDMRHLIESLRTSIYSLATSKDALGMQNSTLRHLQIGSNVMKEIMNAHIEDSSKKSDVAIDMRLHLKGRIKAVALESNGNLHGSFELCNNTNYTLLGRCIFLLNFISRSRFHNSSFGERIVVSRPYLVCDLPPKSSETYKWSVEYCEGISILPMTVEFKLVMKFPGSIEASAFQKDNEKCLSLPLNTCRITMLDVLRQANDSLSLHIPNINGVSNLHRNATKCSCDSIRPIKDCSSIASLKQTKEQPTYSLSMAITPLERNTNNDECSSQSKGLQEFLATVCPDLLFSRSVIPSNSLHLQLPCKHRVKISRHSTSMLLEGDHMTLLLQIQEALCDKIEHFIGTPVVMNLGLQSKTLLDRIKILQRDMTDNTSHRETTDDVNQTITNALASVFKCRKIQFP